MFVAMLACVVIAPNNPHFYCEWYVAPASPSDAGFCDGFSRKEYGANVSEDVTLAVFKNRRNVLRVIFRIKLCHLLREECSTRFVKRAAIVFKSVLQYLLEFLLSLADLPFEQRFSIRIQRSQISLGIQIEIDAILVYWGQVAPEHFLECLTGIFARGDARFAAFSLDFINCLRRNYLFV